MATITIRKPEAKACVKVNGEIVFVGPWPLGQKIKAKKLLNNSNVEIHKARHYTGVDYCKMCEYGTRDPYLFMYEKRDYWKCECGQINFI